MKDFSKKEGQTMKKSIVLTIAAAAIFAACAKDTPIVESSEAIPATISVSIPADGLTKVELEQDSNPDGVVKLTWESTDAITVENAADDTKRVEFTYKSGAGTASAEFSAADISPLAGATSYNICLTSNLPGGFTSQTQASDGSTAHLGYAATLSGVNKYDGATFSQSWATSNGGGTLESSSVLRIRAQMPTAAMADAVQKVIVKSSVDIFDGDDELSVTITTPGVAGDSKIVTVYATLPAGNVDIPADTELLFQFQVSDDVHDKYTAYRKLAGAKTLSSGKVNFFKISCPDIESFAGSDDDGTSDHPYLIGDRHQMDKAHDELVDGRVYFKMVDDVDLSGVDWAPLNDADAHQIDFNGAGHTIYNLSVDNSTDKYAYSGFIGFLYGFVHDVVFDGADVKGGNKNSGIVSGRSAASSHAANYRNVTVRNSTLTSSNNYVGGLAGYVKKSDYISNCHVVNTTLTSTCGNVNPSLIGGLVGELVPNGGCSITDCSAERVSITGGCTNYNRSGVGGLVARIGAGIVTIDRCHTSGEVAKTSSAINVGGLVGIITSAGHTISNSYSTCSLVRGYRYVGGLVGRCTDGAGVTIGRCFASGDIPLKAGYGGRGGLVGAIHGSGVTITNSVAWNDKLVANNITDESSGAVVGFTHPNSILTNNYRKPGMTFSYFCWAPSTSFDHANVNGISIPLQRITDANDENALIDGTAEDFALDANKQYFAYHGKHLPADAVVEPDDNYGWVSDDVPGSSDPDPEDPAWSGDPTIDLVSLGGTKRTLSPGVEWTTFEGTWEGAKRNINVIKTTLNATNHLGVYYNYKEEGYKYLDEKCEYLNAVAGTNGSMACCQFTRVDDVVKHGVTDASYYTSNCALTIDGDNVRIVKTDGNTGAAMLPNRTVTCAGPLLVWKGNIQTYTEEGSEDFLANTHPRTAIGLSKDNQTVIQVSVDGRWTGRGVTGMSTALLSRLMKGLGCYKAINFDGGGGTQMWVDGYGDIHNIVNHPHNEWPTYGCGSGKYYWIKDNEVARRTCGSAVYVYTD